MTPEKIIENAYWKSKTRKDDSFVLNLQFVDVVRLMNDFANRSKWISVDERLPDIGEKVLIFSKCLKTENASYEGEGDWDSRGSSTWVRDVTHWQQLPTPPKP